MDIKRFPELIAELYSITSQLEQMFPGRHFTPDGHMVGSLGECLAMYYYGLELLPASSPGCDARLYDKKIEIKTTQGDRVSLRSCPEHLLVFKIHQDGSFEEIYNAYGKSVWELFANKPRPSNGQYQVSLSTLKRLMSRVHEREKIQPIR